MFNDQKETTNSEPQPPNVVVSTQIPNRPLERQGTIQDSTRVDVYPTSPGINNELATDPGAQSLQTRQEVVRQRRFGVGKTIDLCWYALGVLEVVLAIRFFFELTAANSGAGVVQFIVGISQPFSWPFNGIFPVPHDGNNVFDTNTLIAMAAYALVVWGITRLLALTIEPPSVR